ncbi:helix-turn-helix domain-containing protein [Rhodovulum sp. 12E13]|uniref:DUF6456 domain-containing protein n=1 Tax=Rhodovulum sp. 12E13 TaxID=2203891 RepID=UPI000E14C74C|nr:DUF6456 domain-containing protein [Rhodovulum sp. 12E13]RDC74502.1 helix-turn-helix domain-containing protein [Rhodovulum sp. 12E13]
MKRDGSGSAAGDVPGWVPAAARHYLRHTEGGLSIREVARHEGCHASTILRQIRRLESRRDDPLVDEALARLGQCHAALARSAPETHEETDRMTAQFTPTARLCDEETLNREARRVLRRLSEPGALLAVAPDMDKAAVLRETEGGQTVRTAVLDRAVAQAFALNEWIACSTSGRVARYRITATGRTALRRLLAEETARRQGMAEGAAPFAEQHRDWGERDVAEDGRTQPRRMRYNMAESPVTSLARRREKDGTPFLAPELVAAAERLREDFELAQMGPKVAQNWERFLTGGGRGGFSGSDPLRGPEGARARVAAALRDLGPGLGDTALRVCCYLEGLEATEKRMGWSARSGKIVLRIALQRLHRHYQETYGPGGGLIG